MTSPNEVAAVILPVDDARNVVASLRELVRREREVPILTDADKTYRAAYLSALVDVAEFLGARQIDDLLYGYDPSELSR